MTESNLYLKGAAEAGASQKSREAGCATDRGPLAWTLVSAVSDEQVLNGCLLASPTFRSASETILQKGYTSAAVAYNDALSRAKTDLVVFVHQDVYLPEGWIAAVQNAIRILSETDPDWGALGVWGPRPSGGCAGYVYDGGWRRILGNTFEGGVEVESLDEVVLILRKSTGLCFDPQIPGFHMYGADICMEARHRHRKCYAISAFCLHNTNQYRMLPWQFWRAYLAMRRKWKDKLPITTTCTEITKWCWPMLHWNLLRAINLTTGRDKPPTKRVSDPSSLYRELVQSGKVVAALNPRG